MKKFGKIENGVFIEAPNSIKDDKFTYFNPKDEIYLKHGYLPVIYSEFPANFKSTKFKQIYEDQGSTIIIGWEELPEESIEESKDSTMAKIEALEAELAALKASLK
jgi:hypothetical protein